ncbi:flagellar hook-length control protein FliK, partial [Metabacillus litoralis]|uniref:flagellar hook-length control protein FliK n=1 Tax=Metabacillus litoralis TaxID=152268 RepID=UPI00203DB302
TRKENIEDREYTPSFKTFEATIQDQFMSIDSTEISNDNRLLNDLQNESKNQSWITQNNQVKNEENNEISVVKTCKENIEDREYTPSAKTFEATINLLYSELNQLSETSGIDLSHILKEFVSLLNQYTSSNEDSKQLEKNVRNDFTNNMNIIEQVQMGRETSIDRTYTHLHRIQEPFDLKTDRLKSKISLETALPFDRIFEQRKATPIIDNIMEISKTVDDVADELSVDVNEVFPEIEKIGYDFLNLPSLNRNDQQISNGIVRNEVIRQIVPLMKSVRQFIKGVELLSTEKSIELTEIFSKVENSLQTELFKFALEGQKVTLIDDVPHLYEFLVSNLSKQDGKLKGKISEQSSAANETVTPKINNPFASQILTENPIESLNQQRIKMTYSQFQSRELTKKVEGNEERFTIQIDKFITNQTGTPLEFTKTELPTRQEFTNQLLNVFKTSKFAQLPNGANRLVIKLNPDHLGSLTVKLVQKNGEMIARIMASTESAKELLDHSVHQLKQVLPSVQIEIERFEIFTEPFSRELREQSNHKDKNEKEHEATNHEDEQENEKSFIDSLNEVFNITV